MIRGWPHHIVKLCELVETYRPRRAVEIGTYCGASAIPIAQRLQKWGGTLLCVDIWQDVAILTECRRNIIAAGVGNMVFMRHSDSLDAARHWVGQLDFIYIDGDHSYESVRADVRAWWALLKSGGIICGDDYDDPVSPGVKQAWDEFEREHGLTFEHYATPNTEPPGMKLVWGIKP